MQYIDLKKNNKTMQNYSMRVFKIFFGKIDNVEIANDLRIMAILMLIILIIHSIVIQFYFEYTSNYVNFYSYLTFTKLDTKENVINTISALVVIVVYFLCLRGLYKKKIFAYSILIFSVIFKAVTFLSNPIFIIFWVIICYLLIRSAYGTWKLRRLEKS